MVGGCLTPENFNGRGTQSVKKLPVEKPNQISTVQILTSF